MVVTAGIGAAARLVWAGLTTSLTRGACALAHNAPALTQAYAATKFGKWGALGMSALIRIPLALDTFSNFLGDTRRQREIMGGQLKQNVSRQAANDASFWSICGMGALGLSSFKLLGALSPSSWQNLPAAKVLSKVRGFGCLTTALAIFCLAKRYITTKAGIDAAFNPSMGLSLNGPMLMVDDESSGYNGYSYFLEKSAKTRAMEDATWGKSGQKYRDMIDPYIHKLGDWMYGANPPPGYMGGATYG